MANVKLFEWPQETGLTSMYAIVLRRSDGYYLNDADGAFAAAPVDKFLSATEHAVIKGLYQISESRSAWTEGMYLSAWYLQAGGSPSPAADQLLGTSTHLVVGDYVTVLWQAVS